MANARTNARFADVLLKARLIDELQLKSAAAHVEQWGGSLPHAVAELGFAEEDAMLDLLAKSLRLPAMHLGNLLKDNTALRALGVDYCEQFAVFPVTLKDRVLTLAMADPTDLQVVDDAGSKARARVHVVMAAESEIRTAIAKHFRGQDLPQPRRKTNSQVKKTLEPGEEKLEFDLTAPPQPGRSAPRPSSEETYDQEIAFSPEELQRLDAVRQNQDKVGHILRTVTELLMGKGLLKPPAR